MQSKKFNLMISLFFIGLLVFSTLSVYASEGLTEDVAYVEIEPADDFNVTAGEEFLFNATAYDGDGTEITDDEDDFDWQNAPRGVFYEEDIGVYEVTATYDGVTSEPTNVTVEPADVDYIQIEPEDSTISAGNSQKYNATSYDEYHNEIENVTEETEWSIDTDNSSWEENEVTVNKTGTWEITGEYGEFNDTANLTVESATVDHVAIDPEDDKTVEAGERLIFNSTAYDAHGNLITEDEDDFEWENAPRGVFREKKAGEYDVTATYDGVTSNVTTVTVVPGPVDYVEIDPDEDQTIKVGEELQFTASAYDEFHNLITDDVTNFNWENISEFDEEENIAIFYEEEADDYNVTAEYNEEISPETKVTVGPYILEISSTKGGEVIEPGENTFEYDHGEVVDLEAVADEGYHFVEWTGDNGTIGDTTSNTTDIEMLDDYSITANFEPNELDRVKITPETDQEITAGNNIDFDATAYDEFGNIVEQDDTNFTWQNTSETGLFDETTVGNYDVSATYEGLNSSVVTVTVNPGEPDRIVIIEYPEVITAGDSDEMTIEAYDKYDNLAAGGELDNFTINSEYDGEVQFKEAITFNETGKYVATIPEEGVITADDAHEITATSNPSDSVNITVEPGPVDRVEIDPSEDQEVEAEEQLEFTAEAYDEYDNLITEDVTDFEWENIDQVDGDAAVFSEEEAGEYDVTATLDDVTSDPTTVTIEDDESEPDVGVADLCNLWWIWIVLVIIIILLLVWFFWKKKVTLTVEEIEGEGRVHVDTIEVAEVPYKEDYKKGEEVELLAYPIEDYEFSHWTGVPEERAEELEILIEMDEDKTITAVFEREETTEEALEETSEETREEEDQEEQKEMEEEIFVEESEEETAEDSEEMFEEEGEEEIFEEEGEEEIFEEEETDEESVEEIEEDIVDENEQGTLGKSQAIDEFGEVKGIGPTNAERLYEGGFESIEQLKEASIEEITDVKGIGNSTAEMIFENLKG